jgi:hypothetical protein
LGNIKKGGMFEAINVQETQQYIDIKKLQEQLFTDKKNYDE